MCGVFAQTSTDTIEIRKSLGTTFLQNGKKLTPKQLTEIMQSNPAALESMKKAKSNYGVSSVLGYAAGFLIGWPIGTAIAGGEPEWALAGVGAGIAVVSIPITSAYNRHAKEAVRLYNTGLTQTSFKKTEFKLGLAHNGIKVKMMF